jgi:hypothetical protein
VKRDDAQKAQDLAQRQNLDPLEVRARVLEQKAKDIAGDFEYMRGREYTHRDTNESTNTRTTTMMAVSMLFLVALAAGQNMYLKRYFKQHKVI